MNPDVLQIKNLHVYYKTLQGSVKAVEDVSINLKAEERLGLVGESGSGKSTVVMSILRLIKPPGYIEGGEVSLIDTRSTKLEETGQGSTPKVKSPDSTWISLFTLSDEEMRQIRLARIALIAQGSMNSLNPVVKVRKQLLDGIKDHGLRLSKQEANDRVRELLEQVNLKPEVGDMYPHELSGGMKQRVCIAIAISLRPKVIIADEPTSALDVVVQSLVIETLHQVQKDLNASVLMVGHDMGLMAQSVDRLAVMYAGRLVEVSPVEDIFTDPLHPYTKLLIKSLPSLKHKGEFHGIPGLPPSLINGLKGCPFHPRCPFTTDRCRVETPQLQEILPNRQAACHLLEVEKKL